MKAVLAAAALGYLVYVVEPDAIADALAGAHTGWIAAAVALLPVNVAAQTVVWYVLLRRLVPGIGAGATLGSLLCGRTLGLITPANAGDPLGRAYYLPGCDRWHVAGAAFLHQFAEMTASVAVGTLAMAHYVQAHAPAPRSLWQGLVVAGSMLSFVLLVLVLWPGVAYRLAAVLLRGEQARARLAFLRRLPPEATLAAISGSLVTYGVVVTQFFCLVRAFEPGAPVFTVYLGIALVYFVKYLVPQVTLLDVGIREGAAVYFLGHLGLSGAAAFNASFLLFCINLLLPAAAGLPFVFRLRLGGRAAGGPAPPAS